MNGDKIPLYSLEFNDILYYPCDLSETDTQKSLTNIYLKDLKLLNGDNLYQVI